jgi:hypothetical protein
MDGRAVREDVKSGRQSSLPEPIVMIRVTKLRKTHAKVQANADRSRRAGIEGFKNKNK